MSEFAIIVVTASISAAVAVIGWVLNRAFDRQEKRQRLYGEILDQTPLDDRRVLEKLLIFAPDYVVEKANDLVLEMHYRDHYAESRNPLDDPIDAAYIDLVAAMRADCSVFQALRPRLRRKSISKRILASDAALDEMAN